MKPFILLDVRYHKCFDCNECKESPGNGLRPVPRLRGERGTPQRAFPTAIPLIQRWSVGSTLLFGAALLLLTTAAVAEHSQPVVHFVTAGDETTIPLPRAVAEGAEAWQLKVFGRTLANLTAEAGAVRFQAPDVRAVTHLTLSPAESNGASVADVFVYPKNQNLPWKEKTPLGVATPCPTWITQWLQVAGAAAGDTVNEIDKLYRDAGCDVLLLSAPWFGATTRRSKSNERIVAANLTGPLSQHSSQPWSRPVVFTERQQPFPGMINRRSFIRGQSGPIVEELRTDWRQGAAIASYVPWQLQLGRNELADRLLFDLLVAVAKYQSQPVNGRRLRLVSPDTDEPDAAKRPVLAAAIGRQPKVNGGPVLNVFDLRGPAAEDVSVETVLRAIRRQSGESPVLVLGDDSDRRVEQAMRRERKKSKKLSAHLTWIPADGLPPSAEEQLRLMEVLTELGVPVGILSSTGVMK